MPVLETLRAHLRDPMALGALAVSLLPLVGLVAWGWSLGALVVLYWVENVLIGAVNVARMLASGFARGPGATIGAVFMGAFFTVHYGGFCAVHGVFVWAMFAGGFDATGGLGWGDIAAFAPHFGLVVAVMAAWKVAEFLIVFLGRGEVARAKLDDLMAAPYGRIFFLHIGIFAAGFALMAVGEPVWGVALLALAKTAVELVLDLRRRAKAGSGVPAVTT